MTLRCTIGPSLGQSIAVDSELVLGREEPDPGHLGGDARLSRRHARIFIDGQGQAIVEDLGSTNGTWVNEERLSAPHICVTGDVLRVGQSTFELEVAPPVTERTEADVVAPRTAPTVAEMPTPVPVLRVTAGPQQGEEIPLGQELLIGRSYGEPGALGGDRKLSRRHARIARGPGGVFFIEDTGSSNGTVVNGVQLRRAVALKDGDEIAIGSSVLQASGLGRAPAADAPLPAAAAAPPPAAAFTPPAPAAQPPAAFPPAPVAPPPPGAAVPPIAEPAPAAQVAPGQFAPQGAAVARLSSRRGRVIGVFATVFAAAAIISGVAVVLLKPLGTKACPSGFVCHPPPTAPPLRALTTFTGSLGWHLEYDTQMATPQTADARNNQLSLRESNQLDQKMNIAPGSGRIGLLVRAYKSSQVSPQAAVNQLSDLISGHLVGPVTAPSSDQMFGRPVLGFHPGLGVALEGSARTPQGPGALEKVAVISAASGGVTIALALVYPVQRGAVQGHDPDLFYDRFGDVVIGTIRFPSDGAT